jgi:hypothetical protein
MGRKPKHHLTRAQSFGRSQPGKAELSAAAASVSLRVRWAPDDVHGQHYRTRSKAVCLRVLPAKFSGSVRQCGFGRPVVIFQL